MPIFVCAFWSVLLLLDLLEGGNKSKRGLLAYMLTTCGLYFAHIAFLLFRKDPQRDIPETALKCGYSSLSSFYRNFRLYQGGSPKEYCTSVL